MNYIYLIRNKVNGKLYVGKTSKTIDQRWRQHLQDSRKGKSSYLYNAMRKYGEDVFSIMEIDRSTCPERLNDFEKYWISFYDSHLKDKGYNCTFGGDGGNYTPEIREKIGQKSKENWENPEYRDRVMKSLPRGADSHRFGIPLSDEHKKKMGDELKRKLEELGISGTFVGKNHTDATKVILSDIKKVQYLGKGNPAYREDISDDKVKEMFLSGLSPHKIAPFFNAGSATIYKRCKKMGLYA